MSYDSRVHVAVRRALLAGLAAAAALPVMAQDTGQVEPVGEVVTVTGTRIQRQDYEAVSPLATVTAEAIRATGELNTEAVLNTLPQVIPGLSSFSNNPADGTATVDLRGLGPTRTLVLIDGGNFADDRGNLTAFASWYDREQVLQSARDYTRVNFASDPGLRGSSIGVAGRFDTLASDPFTDAAGDPLGPQAVNRDGSVRPFIGLMPDNNDGLAPPGVGDRYNFNPVNNLLTPAERVTIGALGHLDVSDSVRAYTELLYVDSKNSAQLAETPAQGLHVSPDSPLLSQSARDLLASRVNAVTGARASRPPSTAVRRTSRASSRTACPRTSSARTTCRRLRRTSCA